MPNKPLTLTLTLNVKYWSFWSNAIPVPLNFGL